MASNNITWLGNSYTQVGQVDLPKTGGGTATFHDVTDTTATASDVSNTKYFYTAAGVRTQGTNSGGSSMNVQIDNTNHRISGTTYTDTGASITVSVAGKYDIYWSAFRSSTSSGTNGTQCYVGSSTQGSAFTSWENSYCQSPKLTGVTLAKNAVVKVYARASSNSRYVCVSNLTIVQTE